MRGALAVLVVLLVAPAAATHLPCPPQDCPVLQPIPKVPYVTGDVDLLAVNAKVRATEGLATTSLELRLQAASTAEAVLNIPMPGRANLKAFNLTVGDKVLEGRVQEISAARAEYDAAKAAGQDAAILEQVSDRLVRLRVNVPAGEDRTLRVTYVEMVPLSAGARVYRLPLSQLPEAGRIDVEFTARAAGGVQNLRFPSLSLAASSEGDATVARFSGQGRVADLVAVWDVPTRPWAVSLVASRPAGQQAEWVAEVCLRVPAALPRDVVFVLDRSGSMLGDKILEARTSLQGALAAIAPGDRYDVVLFDSHTQAFHDRLVAAPASGEDQSRVGNVQAAGGTDIDGGLQAALRVLASAPDFARMPMVVFLTDGLPSAGITDHDAIIERFIANNSRGAAIQVVPIGLDADHTFLADLALRSGGSYTPMDPADGGISLRLGRLYDVLAHPVLRNVDLAFDGIALDGALPEWLPAIYEDGCLQVAFRGTAQPGAPVSVHVAGIGMRDGAPASLSEEFAVLPLVDPAAERIWAAARVERMLSQERVEGTSPELRAAILAEAVALRQVTPYTAWVITDQAAVAKVADMDASARLSAVGAAGTSPPTATGTAPAPSQRTGRDFGYMQEGPMTGADGRGATGTTAPSPATATPSLGLAALAVALLAALWWSRRT